MAGPKPSSAFLSARRTLRDEAISRTERRLGVSSEVMPAIARLACDELVPALGDADPRHAGWGTLAAGTLIARNCERLSGAEGEAPNDRSFTAGLAWAALLTGVVGDRLLDVDDPLRARPWEPGEPALAARAQAAAHAPASARAGADAANPRALAGIRFAAYARSQLDAGLPRLEPQQAGFALVTLAAWIAANAPRIAEPLLRRRWLARRSEIDREAAVAGCRFEAWLLAQIGDGMLPRLE